MAEQVLEIKTRQGSSGDHVLIVELIGPLMYHNLFDFQQIVRASGSPVLIVEMTRVPYVDSAGAGALVGAYVSYQKEGHRLALVGVVPRVKNMLSMTQVERFFTIYNTVADAEAGAPGASARNAANQS
jgi:anti-sigma B factor antagonist